ncbi:hypothetical protein PAXRUDRAFT_825681 [Paxillus rubicundulus Ve08.2h10]|uniref:Unplaced genomic scaffold scaffold_151, whole genome shotgun sequence n=1 Tax=Paxillus rubicundulus Ve08.2h10 TaxID=930991 RepID=A0A0D0DFY5_9AGAM|nr:hypothetical protein PAXRUDRAFT_825681 [Paxillus rubicundulus Ve08.2h10]
MSAYGSISRPSRASYLPSTAWQSPRDAHAFVTLHHIDQSAINLHPGLFDYLHSTFADEVDKGLTYPQEDVRDPNTFGAYFFGADVFVAISSSGDITTKTELEGDIKEVEMNLEGARGGRSWEECVTGFYYVKPNYPGRSSHICNAGFVVPPSQRGGGYGRVLARSYLHYAPSLGYTASVFNLVYVNNVASVRLWEKLNFIKAGLIPKAGRLKRKDGPGEEYVDAWVFYKSFEDVNGDTTAT